MFKDILTWIKTRLLRLPAKQTRGLDKVLGQATTSAINDVVADAAAGVVEQQAGAAISKELGN